MASADIPGEHDAVAMFKRVAEKVRPVFVANEGRTLTHRFGGSEEVVEALSEQDLLKLLLAIRLVYLEKEIANFGRVSNYLARRANNEMADRVKSIKEAWKQSLNAGFDFIVAGERYGPKEVFETVLNADLFHQDLDKQEDLARLRSVGLAAEYQIHVMVMRLAACVLALEDLLIAAYPEVSEYEGSGGHAV